MKITISNKQGSTNYTDQNYAIEKIENLGSTFNFIESAEIIFHWERGRETSLKIESNVEIIVNSKLGKCVSRTYSEDRKVRSAFDNSYHKIQMQLRKLHDKVVDHRKERC